MTQTAYPTPFIPSRLARALEVASDLLIATALVWTPPLLFGLAVALVRLIMRGN